MNDKEILDDYLCQSDEPERSQLNIWISWIVTGLILGAFAYAFVWMFGWLFELYLSMS